MSKYKYSEQDRANIIRKWNDGVKLEEIGKEYGISKQAVSLLLRKWCGDGRMRKCYGEKCVYPGIRKWMVENRICAHQLGKVIGCKHAAQIYVILQGKHVPSKPIIDRLLAATGLTYEQAFGSAETPKGKPAIELGDDFFGAVLNCAVRYCIGRVSYMPGLVTDFIGPILPHLSNKTLWCMKKDIEVASSYGMDMDKEMWMSFLSAVKEAKKERENTRGDQEGAGML